MIPLLKIFAPLFKLRRNYKSLINQTAGTLTSFRCFFTLVPLGLKLVIQFLDSYLRSLKVASLFTLRSIFLCFASSLIQLIGQDFQPFLLAVKLLLLRERLCYDLFCFFISFWRIDAFRSAE